MKTFWIDPDGNLIDITSTKKVHWDWLKQRLKLTDYNDLLAAAATGGWIKAKMFPNIITFDGRKKDINRCSKVIRELVDSRLFSGNPDPFRVTFELMNDNWKPVQPLVEFYLPDQDQKLLRFL